MTENSDAGRLPGAVRGPLWMLASGVCFSLLALSIRFAAREVHPFEIVFFRTAVNLAVMVPVLWRIGFFHLRSGRILQHATRSTTGLVSMSLMFAGISAMPIADATALTFTIPLFATAGAALFLGETVRVRRWAAIIVGFCGMLIILRPGIAVISLPAFLVLGGSIFAAVSTLLIKDLSRTEHPDVIVFYFALFSAPIAAIPAVFVWQWPSPETLFWLVMVGICATGGHMTMTRAFAAADASAVFPYDYSRLIFAAILAYFAFSEIPDLWTWIGGGVIFLSSLYISHREAKAARAARERGPAKRALEGLPRG